MNTTLEERMDETIFTFDRGRGIVWVCDIEKSSKFLNSDESAQAIEHYLPRLHWLGRIAVTAAGGHFIKWTGDGFLGWFPTELHRELGSQAAQVVHMIWQITVLNNITRLGVEGNVAIRLKHGLTVEHDALITKISDRNGHHFDLIGRAVVLAFRLSGIKAAFPGIVTQREIVEAIERENTPKVKFRKMNLRAEEKAKYFKGDRWGTSSLYASAERKPRITSKSTMLRTVKEILIEVEKPATIEDETNATIRRFMKDLQSGPIWTQTILNDYLAFLREDLLGALKASAHALDSSYDKQSN